MRKSERSYLHFLGVYHITATVPQETQFIYCLLFGKLGTRHSNLTTQVSSQHTIVTRISATWPSLDSDKMQRTQVIALLVASAVLCLCMPAHAEG